eukprot:CAMPEP_0172513156 /NCGR_PEP_ID=MMETSP1066-20121228/250145_1 /TAXON_ID=671091 /ORGANISM="Coscinodiscus wailesii, Strain CCMP2513" /LENGTH=328 /DNA_ID=CAMNT_0013293287 /DNA_START=53 /DNA_END=1039 /DNA_ORIENTATION=+
MVMASVQMTLLQTLSLMVVPSATGFGIWTELSPFIPVINDATTTISPFLHNIPSHTIASTIPATIPTDFAQLYRQALTLHPLGTKMITGGILAVMGDGIAQSKDILNKNNDMNNNVGYDTKRAISFALFDMCYRAMQQVSFPSIADICDGSVLNDMMSHVPAVYDALSEIPKSHDLQFYFSAMEQTVAFQFGIVPFLYYPVFFALTGSLQGLTVQQSIDRAKEMFFPLMKRNLLFWIPVQFITFSFVDEQFKIPVLCVSGLIWTFILSVAAGSAKQTASGANDELEPLLSEIDPDYVGDVEPQYVQVYEENKEFWQQTATSNEKLKIK